MAELHIDPAIALGLRAALAFVLMAAAAHKLEDQARFRAILMGYDLLPPPLLPVTAVGLAFVEMALAISLLIFPVSATVALSVAAVFSLYGVVMALTILRGRRHLECGCGAANQPIGWGLVGRNGVLTLLAVTAATPAHLFGLNWLGAVTALFIAAMACIIYLASDALLANHARFRAAVEGRA